MNARQELLFPKRRTFRPIAIGIVLSLSGCSGCGDKEATIPEAVLNTDVGKLYQTLFQKLPRAKVKSPLDAVPADLAAIGYSDDPEAWRAWAEQREFVKSMVDSPLVKELRISSAYLTLRGLHNQAAQAATVVSDKESTVWKGPTAFAIHKDPDRPKQPARVLLIKSIDPKTASLVRYAASFAYLKRANDKGDLKLSSVKAGEVDLLSIERPGQSIGFVLFQNLLIAGDDLSLVRRAVMLAQGKPENKDQAASAAEDRLLPAPGAAGVHLSLRPSNAGPFGVLGMNTLGVSLVMDAAAPVVLRRSKVDAKAGGALLRYAPASTFFALVDPTPATDIAKLVKARLEGPLKVSRVDLEKDILSALEPGVAFFMGTSAEPKDPMSPGAALAFSHSGKKKALEPKVRSLLKAATGSAERVVLQSEGGAILLRSKSGPAFALTDDALLVALSEDTLRACLAAGAAKAPSLKDKVKSEGPGALYLDLPRAGAALTQYYERALQRDRNVPWPEVQAKLTGTFEALKTGGVLFAELKPGQDHAEGALRVVP